MAPSTMQTQEHGSGRYSNGINGSDHANGTKGINGHSNGHSNGHGARINGHTDRFVPAKTNPSLVHQLILPAVYPLQTQARHLCPSPLLVWA